MMRYEDGPSEVVVAASGSTPDLFPVGSHHRLGGENATTRVFRTGRPARLDDFPTTATGPIGDAGRSSGIRSVVATPITVAGRLWGAMTMATRGDPPPPHTESSLAEFTELMATAIANTESRARADRLAGEQAGLRRLATLVAQEAPLAEVFARVAEEVARTAGDVDSALWRDDGDGTVTAVAVRGPGPAPGVSIGTKLSLDGDSVIAQVLREGRPHRIDDYSPLTGSIAERARALGLCSAVGCPIAVGSRTWGVMTVATHGPEPFAPETETRVARFSDLVATAIANAEARKEVERLAAEQAALRRVATLVAEEQSPAEVFAKVAEEAAKVLENVECAVLRDSGNDSATVVAALGAGMSARFPVGTRLPTDGDGVLASALRDGWPQRIEYGSAGGATAGAARELGISSAVATPIAAREWIWGAIVAARFDGGSCPPDTETRLAQFADLVATAIANVDARAQVERLAEEQAALRRVAMLAAAGASSTAVLDAVAAEMEALLDADQVTLTRFEPGDDLLVLANRGREMARTPVGSRVSIEGDSAPATVRRTGRPARMEGYASAEGAIAEIARDTGLRSSVSAPISVEGGLWGVITASWKTEEPPPPETEERMVKFAEVLDTAIANAETRDQLTASRARLVTAGDEARRQVVRDLHDGAQQRLVHAIVTLKLAQRALRQEDERTEALLGEALEHAEQGNEELRELAHGILPAVLTRGGLRAGVNALVARLDLPVRVQVSSERLPAEIEASAYFLVAEALTNVMKHAHAARAGVTASVEDGVLRLEVRDDGIGGADIGGHGLVGMADRVSAHGGQLSVDSPEDAGTLVTATLPLSTDGAASFSGQEAITPAPRAARAAAPARARRAR
jgi:signal transduction histidine kinase